MAALMEREHPLLNMENYFGTQLFKFSEREDYKTLEDTPLVVVKTEQELQDMIRKITGTHTLIGMDVEYSTRTNRTCLVQISTRDTDYILDPLAKGMGEKMHQLNEITRDPRILKVLHGAENDVLWLMQDFNLRLVSVFDTHQAMCRVREVQPDICKSPGFASYANMVLLFCGVRLDKSLQTTDWTKKLSEEMLKYARCDTHYLLFCFDSLRNMLLCMRPSPKRLDLAAAGGVGFHVTGDGREAVRAVMWHSVHEERQESRSPSRGGLANVHQEFEESEESESEGDWPTWLNADFDEWYRDDASWEMSPREWQRRILFRAYGVDSD